MDGILFHCEKFEKSLLNRKATDVHREMGISELEVLETYKGRTAKRGRMPETEGLKG